VINKKLANIKIISAGAGSGKTYRLTEEMVSLLQKGVRASGIIATTFTNKAAAELQERVRVKLLEKNLSKEADQLANALIGTVHGLGVKLLKRFAFEAGVSPQVAIIADGDHQFMFNQSLSTVLTQERMERMDFYSNRLGLNKKGNYDWRREVKEVTDIARANDFDTAVLEKSKLQSFEEFKKFLGKPSTKSNEAANEALKQELERTIQELENNEDSTKVTQTGINTFKNFLKKINLKGALEWHEWVKISKTKVGSKSKVAIEELVDIALKHDSNPVFHEDIRQFIYGIFDIAIEAIKEYENYKKRRGLIDYTDMELKVKQLLNNPQVQQVLKEELDLLMVDEFQDTSPIQLEIFLKLSQFAKYSIWVGDPKQSIYGFRGADPSLMMEIIKQSGGVKEEDIQPHSWRSRSGIVHATNAIFCKAFDDLPQNQVALNPQRTEAKIKKEITLPDNLNKLGHSLLHWHFHFDGQSKRSPGRPWMENCIAHSIKEILASGKLVFPKEEAHPRLLQAGDIAVLCRSNALCNVMAEALHRAGIKAAIARTGLLETAESKLVLACLKFIVSKNDALSIAEILKLAANQPLKEILKNRLEFLEKVEQNTAKEWFWASETVYIEQLNKLRELVTELSSSEIINLVLEELDLRRIIVSWGNAAQRLGNIDELRQLALSYEENCNRLHTAATLGGFLLWLSNLGMEGLDNQSSGVGKDAVNVMTYHKSKGLEWPMVICHDLEGNLRDKIWGVQIVPETEEVDLDNILGNRWLRYWVNPYADQIKNTLLEERINGSQVKKMAKKEALKEEARVLYVGITRARDYLIFPTRNNPSKWLNRVWHKGDETVPTLDHYTDDSPWIWEDQILKLDTRIFPYPKDFTETELSLEEINYIEERNGKASHLVYPIDIEREYFQTEMSANIKNRYEYNAQLLLKEEGNQYFAAKATKAFLTVDDLNLTTANRQQLATTLIERFGLEETLDIKSLVLHSKNYWTFIQQHFNPQKVYRQYPIRYHYKNRLFEKTIDFVLETQNGLVIIQNNGFAKDKKEWNNKALKLGPWFFLAKEALQTAFNTQNIRCVVHFPLGGGFVELAVQKAVSVV
jgi:ATP-dependent exoDNAse (exonuclease V) beta subunit